MILLALLPFVMQHDSSPVYVTVTAIVLLWFASVHFDARFLLYAWIACVTVSPLLFVLNAIMRCVHLVYGVSWREDIVLSSIFWTGYALVVVMPTTLLYLLTTLIL